MTYPEADRYIPAPAALLEGWAFSGCVKRCIKCGGTNIRVHCSYCDGDSGNDHECNDGCRDCGGDYSLFLDPMVDAVRDHLIRRLSLPAWMRDGAGLEPWQSAGLIACAAAGMVPRGLYVRRPNAYSSGYWMEIIAGDVYSSDNTTDASAIVLGCALMLTADSMLLPFPGGVRVWRRG